MNSRAIFLPCERWDLIHSMTHHQATTRYDGGIKILSVAKGLRSDSGTIRNRLSSRPGIEGPRPVPSLCHAF